MEWQIAAGRPVYIQLVEQLERAVVTGVYPRANGFPPSATSLHRRRSIPIPCSVRLRRWNRVVWLVTQRTAGRTVTSDTALIAKTRQALAASLAQDFLAQAKALGLTREEILALLQQEE